MKKQRSTTPEEKVAILDGIFGEGADLELCGAVASMPSEIGSWRRPGNHGSLSQASRLMHSLRSARLGVRSSKLPVWRPTRTRHVNTALLIAGPEFALPAVTELGYSLASLKPKPRLPERLQVPLPYREVLESSPDMRPQHRGSPPLRLPRQPSH